MKRGRIVRTTFTTPNAKRIQEMVDIIQFAIDMSKASEQITEDNLSNAGFMMRIRHGCQHYTLQLPVTDPAPGDEAWIGVERGNGTNQLCWDVYFDRRHDLGHGSVLLSSVRSMPELFNLIAALKP